MKDVCEACGYDFERQSGYYNGVVFVSVGIALLEGIITFFAARELVFGLSFVNTLFISMAAVLLCTGWNYKLARVIWLNLFPG